MPLLITLTTPNLTDEDGNDVALVPDEAFADMAHSWLLGVTPSAWRPASPLAAGEYLWAWHRENGPRRLFVDPDLLPETPPTFTDATFKVIIDRADDEAVCSESECRAGDTTRVQVSFMAPTGSPLMLVDVSGPARTERTTLLKRTEDEGFTHKLEDLSSVYFSGLTFGKDIVCVGLSPVAEDGTVGERIDLGCSNPKTGDNFTDLDGEGCAPASTTNAWVVLGALALIVRRRLGARALRGRA